MGIESLIGKKAIRALGVAESFRINYSKSILVGVVCRSDGVVDGVAIEYTTIGGLDATDSIIKLFRKINRKDVHLIMIDGCIISWYNIVDLSKLYNELKIPIISLIFEEIEGNVEEALKKLFPQDFERRLNLFKKLPEPYKVILKTGHEVYVRSIGISPRFVKTILNKFTREGKKPEPIRLAKLIANAILNYVISNPNSIIFHQIRSSSL